MKSRTNIFFKGLSIQTIVTIVMGVMEVVLFALFSRLLSKSDFGYFAAMMGVIAICQSISEAGLGASIIQRKDVSEKFLSTAFALSISFGVFFSALIFLLSPYIAKLIADSYLTIPLRFMSLSFILNSLISVGNAQLYRQLKFKQIGIIRCLSYFLSGVIGIVLAIKGFGLYSIVAFTLLQSFFVVMFLYIKTIKLPKLSFYKSESKEIINYGGWLTLGVILNNLTHQLDKLITPKLLSVETLGAYNRPAGFVSNLTSKVTGIFDNVLFPLLSGIQNQRERVLDVFYKSISLLNSISSILSVVFFFNAELIIMVFFGKDWLNLVLIMRIISVSVLFNVDGQLVDCFFRSLNMVKTGFFIRLIGTFITLTAIIVGTRYGIRGLAVGLVISNVSLILLKVVVLSKKIGANLRIVMLSWIKALKPILPLIIVGLLSFVLGSSLVKYILQAGVFLVVIVFEFVLCPQMVGDAYTKMVYPQILTVKNKLLKGKK